MIRILILIWLLNTPNKNYELSQKVLEDQTVLSQNSHEQNYCLYGFNNDKCLKHLEKTDPKKLQKAINGICDKKDKQCFQSSTGYANDILIKQYFEKKY